MKVGTGTWLSFAALAMTSCFVILPVESTNSSSAGSGGNGTGGSVGAMMGIASQDAGDGPYCATNADCTRDPGHPYLCRSDHTCASLVTSDCPIVFGDSQNSHSVLFGAYTLIIDPDDLTNSPLAGSTTVRDYELAVQELNGPNGNGLPDRGGTFHPLAVVICYRNAQDDAPDYFTRTANHLAVDLQLPAIVADLAPDDLVTVFNQTKDQHVFWISPGPQTQALADLNAMGQLWNMVGSPREVAPIYPALLDRIAMRLQRTSSSLNVAIVRSTDPEPTRPLLDDLYNAVKPKLPTSTDYLIDATHTELQVAGALADAGPDVVISMAGNQFTNYTVGNDDLNGVAAQLEELLLGTQGVDKPRPYYVLNPINFGQRVSLVSMIARFDDLQANTYQRFLGVNVARTDDRTLYTDYVNRLRTFFPGAEEETESWYDSVYYLVYAMYIAGLDKPLDGRSIGAAMASLLSGPMHDVGPLAVPGVIAALQNQPSSIELIGTVGPPDFNPATGARNGNGALFCFDQFAALDQQAQVYVPGDGWSGTFDCYPGFP